MRAWSWWSSVCGAAAALLAHQVAAAATKTVQVGPSGTLTFSPPAVTVDVGDTVEWQWMSGFHSTTRQQGAETWDSGAVATPHTFSHTFTHPGTYPYICTVHVAYGMTGTVTVRPAAVTTTTTPRATVTTTTTPRITTSTTTTAAVSGGCTSIAACETALTTALAAATTATKGKERRVARRLQHLARRAAHQLDRGLAATAARRARLFKNAVRTLERLRAAAGTAESQGTLPVPLGSIDADVGSLESLAQAS